MRGCATVEVQQTCKEQPRVHQHVRNVNKAVCAVCEKACHSRPEKHQHGNKNDTRVTEQTVKCTYAKAVRPQKPTEAIGNTLLAESAAHFHHCKQNDDGNKQRIYRTTAEKPEKRTFKKPCRQINVHIIASSRAKIPIPTTVRLSKFFLLSTTLNLRNYGCVPRNRQQYCGVPLPRSPATTYRKIAVPHTPPEKAKNWTVVSVRRSAL